ncbi:MAG: DnaA regulatory inactivator Hda [gamma proteobacterium symbiont of Bathyaustriella thionipta]|nr:DnaA regulatory inactivator Hda [gamma proteobacterium symbiont of Bathyaustriella thionipta]MCU7950922.1 DnaA regulatory inactivator Hda [gamma proteobacterium symbiont of Bathyaustriella thionipta]MCU7952671.1 DnaA regulatory inactivator Hda [gamma proteobacterium symbiont of Bathyaustriella thionipta]MCU7957420.1 DnaA regulatory inactivator Hda [gamma proteobacterium symbiont of Bathyaustriella thionipta]MCU7967105.1 DnaA regulatory inactivator Hda [gamma proteobacterium symbiont of Bathy
MKNQLPLSFQSPDSASFTNFIAGENEQLIFSLENKDESLIFLWGENGSGKTHLLQALSASYQAGGLSALYILLQLDDELPPELLEGLEMMDLICLDDIHTVIGNDEWEVALFHFFNKIRENHGRLILASNNSAVNLDIHLPDLKSRLSWGLTYQTIALSDEDKIKALKLRARQNGFEMTEDVAGYLLKHATREMPALVKLLEKLDYESLAEQRKLTIPFVKRYL